MWFYVCMNRESLCVHCYWRTKNIKYSKISLRDNNIPGQSMRNLWCIKCIWTVFFTCTPVFRYQYHSTVASHLFVHLSPILYNLSIWHYHKIRHLTPGLTVRSKFVCFGVQVLILCLVIQTVLGESKLEICFCHHQIPVEKILLPWPVYFT